MSVIYIPGPNNEMIPVSPPDTSSRFPINGDFATSASYAGTASYFVGFIESSSYSRFAETASYLLGSIQNAISASWAAVAGNALTAVSASYASWATTASYALTGNSSSYALTASYAAEATTASYALRALTASYSLTADTSNTASYVALAQSSSYALTASYVSGQTSTSSYAIYSETASYLSGTASYAVQALSASYAPSTPSITLTGPNGAQGYINTILTASISDATIVDSFPSSTGNSAKWLVSINDGTNYKTCEITAIWDGSGASNFAEVNTNSVGTVSVSFSVSVLAGNVRLVANPASSTWTIKMIRFLL